MGLYGSTKAAMNHLNLTLECEEPEITCVSIRPAMTDTQMQKDLRSKYRDVIGERFLHAYQNGELVQPEKPGHVIAKLALDAPHELRGKFLM
jgi:NAD(P)-dependent dehydrogenase (short-subunit alcohol dehydrogenase family)